MSLLRRIVCAIVVGHRWILSIDFRHGYPVTQRIECLHCGKIKPSPASPDRDGG